MTRALLIPADLDAPASFVEVHDLSDLQRFVGGYIESAPLDTPDVTLWINEEGKIHGLPRNERADRWWKVSVEGTVPGDYIAGDAVLAGYDPRTGDPMDIPDYLHGVVTASTAGDLLATAGSSHPSPLGI